MSGALFSFPTLVKGKVAKREAGSVRRALTPAARVTSLKVSAGNRRRPWLERYTAASETEV
jgi:hypothetical protein